MADPSPVKTRHQRAEEKRQSVSGKIVAAAAPEVFKSSTLILPLLTLMIQNLFLVRKIDPLHSSYFLRMR